MDRTVDLNFLLIRNDIKLQATDEQDEQTKN